MLTCLNIELWLISAVRLHPGFPGEGRRAHLADRFVLLFDVTGLAEDVAVQGVAAGLRGLSRQWDPAAL